MEEEKLSMREYLYSIRFYVLLVSVVFVGSIIIGSTGFLNHIPILSDIFGMQKEQLQQLIEGIEKSGQLYPLWMVALRTFARVFFQNSLSSFLNIIFGLLIGIFPLFNIFFNGGFVGWYTQGQNPTVFLAIVPHGIFELPAFLLSAAIGLRLGREVLKRKGERHLKRELWDGLRMYLILILPLLLIAALIESFSIVATLSLV